MHILSLVIDKKPKQGWRVFPECCASRPLVAPCGVIVSADSSITTFPITSYLPYRSTGIHPDEGTYSWPWQCLSKIWQNFSIQDRRSLIKQWNLANVKMLLWRIVTWISEYKSFKDHLCPQLKTDLCVVSDNNILTCRQTKSIQHNKNFPQKHGLLLFSLSNSIRTVCAPI